MSTHDEYMTRRQARDLARRLARLERKTRSTAAAHADLRHSALDHGARIPIKDEQGNTTAYVGSGPTGIEHVDGPVPEQPSAPFVDVGQRVVKVQSSGLDVNENPAPADLKHVEVHVAQDEVFEPSWSTFATNMDTANGSVTHSLPAGEWYVGLVWVTLSGKRSVMSELVLAVIEPPVDAQDIQDTLDAAQEALDEYRDEVAAPRFQALEEGFVVHETNISDARDRLEAAESTLAPLPGRITEAERDVETAKEAAESAEARAVEASNNASNRLTNGGFELGLDHWDTTNVALSNDAHTGTQAALIGAGGSLVPDASIPVSEGDVWDVSAYAKNGSALVVDVLDAATSGALETFTTPTAATWSETGRLRVEVPAGVSYVNIRITGDGVLVDDVVLRDVTDVVRLERAATAARQTAEQAIAELAILQLAVDGEGGLKDRLTSAETVLETKADESALDQLDQKLAGDLAAFESHYTRIWRQPTPPPPGVHYEWLGDPHGSVSVRLDGDGNETARNLATNPSFETSAATGWRKGSHVGFDSTTSNPERVKNGNQARVLRWDSGAFEVQTTTYVRLDNVSPGDWVAVSGWIATNQGNTLYARPNVSEYTERGGYISHNPQPFYTLLGQENMTYLEYAYQLKEPTVGQAQVGFYFSNDTTFESPTGFAYLDAVNIAVADSEAAALAQVETYFDGDTVSDRANDLWYNSDGVPHEWVNGQGWVELRDARITELANTVSAHATRLQTAETELEEALEGPIDHDRLRVGTGAFDEAFASKLIADHATIINAAMRNLSVEEKLLFAEAIGEQIWAELGVFDRLQAREGWIGDTLLANGSVTAEKIHATRELITKIMGAEWAYIAEQLVVDGELIANHADMISAAIQNLSVTERADLFEAFITTLGAQEAVIDLLIGTEAWIGGTMLKDDTVTTRHIEFTETLVGNIAELLHLVVDQIDVNSLWADQTWQAAGHFGSNDADQKTEVNGTGVTLYRRIDGELIPAAQFGGGLTQLAFFDGNDSVGSIDQHGNAAFQQLAANHLTVAGREVFPPNPAPDYEGYLWDYKPDPLVDFVEADMAGHVANYVSYGFLEVSGEVRKGRIYRVRHTPFLMQGGIEYYGQYAHTFSTTGDPGAPTTESDRLGSRWRLMPPVTGSLPGVGETLWEAPADGILRVLLTVNRVGSGSGVLFHTSSLYTNVQLYLEDMGPRTRSAGMVRTAGRFSGGGVVPDNRPRIVGRTTTWAPTWQQTYRGNSGLAPQYPRPGLTSAIQGRTPSSGDWYATMLGGYTTTPGQGDDHGQTMAAAMAGSAQASGRLLFTGKAQPLSDNGPTVWYWHSEGSAPPSPANWVTTHRIPR